MRGRRSIVFFVLFYLLVSVPSAYAIKLGDFNIRNDLSLFYIIDGAQQYNKKNAPVRFTWVGDWRYKHLFFFKPIYRVTYTSDLQTSPFYIFTPDFGAYVYKNFALRYQHEAKRTNTGKKITNQENDRLGISYDCKGKLFKGKLTWSNDFQYFPYMAQEDQRIRAVTRLGYGKFDLCTINYYEIEEFNYEDITTISYSLYENKNVDVSLKFQFQKTRDKPKSYRIGMGISF